VIGSEVRKRNISVDEKLNIQSLDIIIYITY